MALRTLALCQHIVPPVALGVVLILTGCTGSMSDLDREAAAMIQRRQALVLGEHGVAPADVAAANQNWRPESSLYEDNPPTHNPTAQSLPARPADLDSDAPVSHEQNSSDGLEAVELDLQGLLRYATQNAPDYRSEKEDLFLATLSLIIERHEWGPRFFNTLSAGVNGTPESGDFPGAGQLHQPDSAGEH